MRSPVAVRDPADHATGRETGRETGPTPRASRGLPIRRRINLPWVAIGVLMVVGSGLVFAAWANGLTRSAGVLTLAREVKAGQVISASDLAVTQINAGGRVPALAPEMGDDVIGRVALVDLGIGTIVSRDLFTRAGVVRPGRALVGVPAHAATLPISDVRSGDSVLVVRTVDPAVGEQGPVVSWAATVFGVVSTRDEVGNEALTVSLDVDIADAPAIAAASSADGVRLILVSSLEDIPPSVLFQDLLTPDPAVPE